MAATDPPPKRFRRPRRNPVRRRPGAAPTLRPDTMRRARLGASAAGLCLAIATAVAGVGALALSASGGGQSVAQADESSPEFTITMPTASTDSPGGGGGGGCPPFCGGGGGGGETSSPPSDPGGGGGGGGGGNQDQAKLDNARTKANAALNSPECLNFVSTAGKDAQDTLYTAAFVLQPNQVSPKSAAAWASVPEGDVGRADGTITAWKPFFNDNDVNNYKNIVNTSALTSLYNAVRTWSADQIRALFLLHEVAHLTGRLPADHSGPWGSNPEAQRAFERELVFHCHP
jgi:hypothetical protein